MKRKVISAILCASMLTGMLAGCGGGSGSSSAAPEASGAGDASEAPASAGGEASDAGSEAGGSSAEAAEDFSGQELSILVSAGWMDNRYDETIARFEETYNVTVDLQTIPADQYSDLLQSKLTTDSCADPVQSFRH